MSAVYGLVRLDERPLDPELFPRMAEAMKPFGRRQQCSWTGTSCALGSAHNGVCSPSLPQLGPFRSASSIRLDNRVEVTAALDSTEQSDGKILQAAFARWGPDGFSRLLGDFCCAHWDDQRRELICAKDTMGVRPLYYLNCRGYLAFASAIRGILALELMPARPNLDFLKAELLGLHTHKALTPIEGVERLLPGQFLRVVNGSVNVHRYWRLEAAPISYRDSSEWAEEARVLMDRAVKSRAHNTGILLSGGLDSSLLAGLLCKYQSKVHTATAIPLSGREDDPDLQCVNHLETKYPQLHCHRVKAQSRDPLGDCLEENFSLLHYPPNAYHFMDLALLESLQNQECDSVLSGFFGDMSLSYSGTDSSARLLSEGKFFKALHLSLKARLNPIPYLIPPVLRRLELRGRSDQDLARLVGSPLSTHILRQHRQDLEERLCERPFFPEVLKARTEIGFGTIVEPWYNLAASKGMEMSFPYLDQNLAEFLLALPPEQFLSGEARRGLIRQAGMGLLPEPLRQRQDKSAYVTDYQERIIRSHNLAELSEQIAASALFDEKRIAISLERNSLGQMAALFARANIVSRYLRWLG